MAPEPLPSMFDFEPYLHIPLFTRRALLTLAKELSFSIRPLGLYLAASALDKATERLETELSRQKYEYASDAQETQTAGSGASVEEDDDFNFDLDIEMEVNLGGDDGMTTSNSLQINTLKNDNENRLTEVDAQEDRLWSAVYSILEGRSLCPGQDQQEAVRFFALLFPQGRRFLSLAFETQYNEISQRLKLLDEEKGLAKKLLGVELLRMLRQSHDTYGHILDSVNHPGGEEIVEPYDFNEMKDDTAEPKKLFRAETRESSLKVELPAREATAYLRAVLRDVVLSVISLTAFAPENVAKVEAALAPILVAKYRETHQNNQVISTTSTTPTTPVPSPSSPLAPIVVPIPPKPPKIEKS